MKREHDRIEVVFEVTDKFAEGGTERTRLEKNTYVFAEDETHVGKILDIFVDFMEDYGFQKTTVLRAMDELIEFEGYRKDK